MREGIQKKGNRYDAVIYHGIDPETGRGVAAGSPVGSRRSDAKQILAEEIKRRFEPRINQPLSI